MVRPSVVLPVSLFLLGAAVAQAQYDPDCKWRVNITDFDELAHHKYQVLEDCLFYKLSKEADTLQGKANALMMLPPTVAAGETLDVDVLNVVVRQMWMNEVWKEMHINGYFALSWKDRRLKWEVADWKADELNIKSYGRLWVPDINSDKHQTSAQSSDYTTYQNIVAKSNGNVTARLEYRMQANCQIDYSDFPADRKNCCFTLQSTLYPRYIKYYLIRGEEGIDADNVRTNWHIEKASVKVLADPDDRKAQMMQMCLVTRRKSTTLSIELTCPMMISALLLIISPFFGTFREQIHVKMFSLLLQFMCFQFLVNKTPQIGFGETVPTIYVFYAFTLAMTIASLVVTVIIAAVARVKRNVPPAHRYTLLASVLNTNLCCGSEGSPKTDGTDSKDRDADWLQIHVAINNLVSGLLLVFYVIGAISIAF